MNNDELTKSLAAVSEAFDRFAQALLKAFRQMAQALHELAMQIFPAYAAAVRAAEADARMRQEWGWRYDIWRRERDAAARAPVDDSGSKVPYDLKAETVWFWRRWVR